MLISIVILSKDSSSDIDNIKDKIISYLGTKNSRTNEFPIIEIFQELTIEDKEYILSILSENESIIFLEAQDDLDYIYNGLNATIHKKEIK